MKKRLVAAFAFTLIALVSCGGSSDPKALTDDGYADLGSGKYPEAVATFEKALSALGNDPSKPEWMRAKMGLIQARTQTDAPRAASEFLELAKGNPSRVTDKEFSIVGGRLGEAKKLDEAVAVLKAGMEAHPESPHLQVLMKQLGDMAKSSGSSEALKNLKGLGYVGGD